MKLKYEENNLNSKVTLIGFDPSWRPSTGLLLFRGCVTEMVKAVKEFAQNTTLEAAKHLAAGH